MSQSEGDDAGKETISAYMTFSEFGLDRRLFKAVARQGFVSPTAVQKQCIPAALQGRDVLARAPTGSGKTLAYCLPLLQKVVEMKAKPDATSAVLAVVLVPTLELVDQVHQVLLGLCHYVSELVALAALSADTTGDDTVKKPRKRNKNKTTTSAAQRSKLTSRERALQASWRHQLPDILVATPGGLVRFLQRGVLPADALRRALQVLVVDEADLVLSYGYESDLRTLIEGAPTIPTASSTAAQPAEVAATGYLDSAMRQQSLLVSATLTPAVQSLSDLVLHNPVLVDCKRHVSPFAPSALGDGASGIAPSDTGTLIHYFTECTEKDKYLVAYSFLALGVIKGKALFFVNSVDRCFRLKLFLERFSIHCAVLNAQLPYNSRRSILTQFNRGVFDYLIATDQSLEDDLALPSDEKATMAMDTDEQNHRTEDGGSDSDGSDSDSDSGSDSDSDSNDGGSEDGTGQGSSPQEPASGTGGQSRKRKRGAYGVSRGIDFQQVTTVVNFDFPTSVKSYTHRAGRTARGRNSGVALSLVGLLNKEEQALLRETRLHYAPPADDLPAMDPRAEALPMDEEEDEDEVFRARAKAQQQWKEEQRIEYSQVARMPFEMGQVEPFRYRVDDVLASITKAAVREARLQEVKLELLNSEQLRAHFEDNPREKQLLRVRHDKTLKPNKVQKHLQSVPDYLLGNKGGTGTRRKGVSGASVTRALAKRKRVQEKRQAAKARQARQGGTGSAAGRHRDPLKSFSFEQKGLSSTAKKRRT